ncbi:MAG: glycoside hydrolase family 99-like domain-containing protein [Planctomycetota bacterium]|nr:glycoside hydrolase family 99-like domain-containing protein [Planctomycetota bacterium]
MKTCAVVTVLSIVFVAVAAAAEPSPLIRDIRVGYLMNCTFRAIRPYIWKQEPLLTGWETDKSGGTWEAKPSGFFPNDFAFNVASFRLRDTSDQRAVTIRHQIARQTAGQITLAFRFLLPAPMEGATWQLRDLQAAAISITVRDGKLCYETSGQPIPLAPLELHHEYGIKALVDLTAKTTDVYVDGELKARAAPFLHPVDSVDYVLIKTGDTAVGELVLPLVSVWKGYSVNETFATCGVGHAPGDWEVKSGGGAATVEPFRCAAQPDAFSLKLVDGAQVTRRFAPLAGKTVWEFKFLLPQKTAGAVAELLAGDGVAGRLVTSAGNLCYVNPQGQPVTLVRDYRANLWYAVKVVAAPDTGKAAVFVNGKLAEPAAEFKPAVSAYASVRFLAGQGTMWVDDVRVYPWQEYPADYVPEPQPVARRDSHLLGVQSCSLWKDGDAYAGWGYVVPFADRRKPYLGWYDEGHAEVADWEIKWQVEHGIDFEIYCWYRPNDAINHPIKDGVLEQGIREGLFNARYSRLKKFAIMYTNQGAGDTNMEDWREHLIPYWIEYFFKDPRYLKVDGKPVFSIYYPNNFQRDFGGVEGCRKATDLLRAECVKAGLPGAIILMELRNENSNLMQTMQAMGIDYCYAYTWGTGDVHRQRQSNLAQRDAAARVGFRMLPSVSMGWQTAPWDGGRDPGNGWAPVPAYQALAQWAKDEFMPTLPESSLGRRMLLLPNWNEFGEGHFLMPSQLAGFGYLDALRDVFTAGGPHADTVPTDAQKRRFTVLYPQD